MLLKLRSHETETVHSEERWMFSAASVCLSVCLFVNTITSKRVNTGWHNLGGRCTLGRVWMWGHSPLGAHPKNVELGYDAAKISAGCLVLALKSAKMSQNMLWSGCVMCWNCTWQFN